LRTMRGGRHWGRTLVRDKRKDRDQRAVGC
jgi:hypothetical protein